MTSCCCGHSLDFHVDTAASVPLKPNPTPNYHVPNGALGNSISRTFDTATYTQQLCHCGCTVWEPLD